MSKKEKKKVDKKHTEVKYDFKYEFFTVVILLVTCLIQGAAVNMFYVPHGFLSGGITGIALFVNYLSSNIPISLVMIVLNIPVVLIGFKFMPKRFMIYSIIGTFVIAFMIEITSGINSILPENMIVKDPMVAAIIGSAIIGVTAAPIVQRGISLGGTDILAIILSKKYSIPIGTFCIIFNIVIMSILIFSSGLEVALMSMIAMFICNTAFNFMLQAMNQSNSIFIISDKYEEIADLLMNEVNRGVTYIETEGEYTGTHRKLIYCIVRTAEISSVKAIVNSIDPHALVTISSANEVTGRGFGSIN